MKTLISTALLISHLSPFVWAADDMTSLKKFRTIFSKELENMQSQFDIDQIAFGMAPELVAKPDLEAEFTSSWSRLSQRYRDLAPSDLFQLGASWPKDDAVTPYAFEETGPVTIVIVPGIFGEFIDNRPYEEVLQAGGAFKDKYQAKLAEVKDEVFLLETLGTVDKPLDELVNIASLDDDLGNPQVQIMFLRPLRGSMETLGTFDSNTQVYLRRLQKVFSIVSEADSRNLFLMGYSRGAPVALDLLAKSRELSTQFPWAKRIKGLVGLAGSFYGTELADASYYASESPTFEALKNFEQLANSLKTRPSQSNFVNEALFRGSNYKNWIERIDQYVKIGVKALNSADPGFRYEMEKTTSVQPQILSFADMMYKFAFQMFKLDPTGGQHFENVEKFKIFVQKSMQGIETLTTSAQFRWWQTHRIPEDVKIYSLTGILPGPTVEGGELSKLLGFSSFGTDTVDYQFVLRGSYYDLLKAAGSQLNDSQVTLYGSRYWPDLAVQLNPNQKPLDHHYLAVLGTHHWGCSFPIAFPGQNGQINDFPRTALLKSVGVYLADSIR